ncbi:MAG: radical SAM protein [Syntrophorhabdales bacterium]|jgi:MoaA/NifB/PqqE/SkfB family radical SAM enzyme
MKPKDKYENLLLALIEQHAGVEDPTSYPIGLVLDPSSACQLNCVFCRTHSVVPKLSGRDQDPMRPRTTMKLPLFQKIMDEMGKYLFSVWLCNWGEPLMNPHFVEMVNILKNSGIDNVGFSSNLSMKLSDDTIEALIKGGLDSITVSIDGITQESYSKYRVKGDLVLALSNMERFVKAKRELGRSNPYILWQFLVFSHNEKEVSEAKHYAERIGVDFKPLAPIVDLVNFPEWLSSLDEYVMDKYKKKPEVPKQSMEEVLESLSRCRYKGCDWHYLVGTINSNSSVSPCCSIAKEADDFGSLDGKTVAEVWKNEMFRAARKYLKNGSPGDPIINACTNCFWPEIRDLGATLQDVFLHCPPEVRQRDPP